MIFALFRTLFVYLFTIISFFLGTTVTLLFVPFAKKKTAPFQTAAHLWSKGIAFVSGISVQTSGFENIPKGTPMIIVANHQGAADIPVLLAYLPLNFRFAVKKELFSIPAMGWYMRSAGFFPVDRAVILSAYKMVEKVIEILKAGENVMIFPEGTRSPDGLLGKFKRGSLMAALKAGVPVLPVAISGSYDIMPRGTFLVNPAKVRLAVAKPVYIKNEEEYDRKVEEVRDSIAALLGPLP